VLTRATRPVIALAVALAIAVAVAACGSSNDNKSSNTQTTGASAQPGKGKPAVTIGAKNFTEQFVLGQLYTQALKAKGYTVTLKQNIGSSEITDKALTSGKIDMYPEYTGIILTAIAHDNTKPKSAEDAYQKAKQFQEGRDFTLLDMTPFTDTDAIGVTKAYAQKNGLSSVADLKKVSSFKLGAPPEFKTRETGIVGLEKDYGLNNIKFTPLAIGLQYKALDSGKVDAADVFTTDGQLQGGKYTVLKDPKNTFGFQNVAPVVSQKVLSQEGPEFAQTLNAVSAKLTVEAMQKMNAAVDLDKQDPKSVAQQFLSANGLV
jgi:osmoprotectant transport system substrate-binding protein